MSLYIYAYVLLFTALVASAAAAIEWGAQGRIPVRHLWSAVILTALLVPPAALAWHAASRSGIAVHGGVMPNRVTTLVVNTGQPATWQAAALMRRNAPIRAFIIREPRWRVLAGKISANLIPVVMPLWICASTAFVAWLLIGALHWRRARRDWRSMTVDGVQIEISPSTGPAVLGIISHRIVMPAWAMSMPLQQRKLMLAHECEHVSARDPQRLALAVLALVLMPWNAVLWWCAARLRRAIELDCDARVLRRYPGAKEYGHLLLDVASRGQGLGSMGIPSVALLRLPSELELRLRAMTQQRSAARRAIVLGATIAVISVAAAFTTPVPELPVLRTNVSKPERAVALRHVTIKVGRSLVTFDSATYSPTAHTIRAGRSTISSLYLASGDTDATAQGSQESTVTRRRKADSLSSLAAQLAAKKHELDAVRARLDSAERALLVTNAQLRSINMRVGSFSRDNAAFTRSIEVERQLREKYLPSAIDRNYPGISKLAKPGMLLWFVVDSSGRVIRTARDESFDKSVPFSAGLVADRFPGIASHDITSTSVTPKVIGDVTVTVVWAMEARP